MRWGAAIWSSPRRSMTNRKLSSVPIVAAKHDMFPWCLFWRRSKAGGNGVRELPVTPDFLWVKAAMMMVNEGRKDCYCNRWIGKRRWSEQMVWSGAGHSLPGKCFGEVEGWEGGWGGGGGMPHYVRAARRQNFFIEGQGWGLCYLLRL